MRRLPRHCDWALVVLITAAALVLRVLYLQRVSPDPFYDAAVRSMGLSWHNFFFGAFEPGGSVSIDKPPVDLWLQVASVKLLGFSTTTLKVPEVLAGTAAVPLLFATVKRMWSAPAGIAAAVSMAVLPVEVITSRSDTMDCVMMLLSVLALWLIVRACETGALVWLLAGAAALGVAFDVKLLESIVALPALALFAFLGLPGSRIRRLLQIGAAGLVYVAVALSWLTATLLFPAHERPYAIGSTNGSAWNAAFVFNGTERLSGKSTEPLTLYQPGHHYPEATQSERDHIPIVLPSPTRLLARVGPLSGERLGLELLIGLLLGIPALALALRERPVPRMRWAVAGGVSLWALTGIVLFSHMARLHPRYVEGFTPSVAILLGIGVAWAASGRSRGRLLALIVGLAVSVYYVERLEYGLTAVWWITCACACAAVGVAVLARVAGAAPADAPPSGAPPAGARETNMHVSHMLGAATIALTLATVLVLPLSVDVTSIRSGVTDAGYVGALPSEEQHLVSAYLLAHQRSARYEVAAESATQIGSLIVQDARPVLVLTTYDARVFTSVARLQRLIAEGQVRYAFLNTFCTKPPSSINAACSAPALWVRAHGTDVSRQAGLGYGGVLYLLPGAKPWTPSAASPTDLTAVADAARAAGRIAIDTEFVGEGRYRTLLCLIQLAVPEGSAGERIELIDPLAPDLDASPLADVLADPTIQVVAHAGRQDVALVRRRLQTEVRNVFDTQIAAGFAGLPAQASYDTLLTEMLGVRLAKSASFTRWDARPLSAEQLAYAREDVVHLLALAGELERRLSERGRLQWAREECEPLERASDERDLETVLARLPRIRGLSAGARALARELVEWREQTAADQDRPVQSVLADAVLVEIAKRRPDSERDLEQIRGAGALRRRAGGVLDAVRRGLTRPPEPALPDSRPPAPRADDLPLIALAEALVRARARDAGLAYELLAARADLQAIVLSRRLRRDTADGRADVRTLRGWRAELVGNELLELLDGRVSLSVRDGRLEITGASG